MSNRVSTNLVIVLALILLASSTLAHVPYFEGETGDFNGDNPFVVRNSIEQSIAVYSWLQNITPQSIGDIDVYEFEVDDPVRVYIEAIVPVCMGYEDFAPWFALVGPGLPETGYELPFEIPEDYGAIVMENTEPGEERETFYEFFGGKSYYEGPVFDEMVYEPGTYYVYYWNPYATSGDYVAVLGGEEIWRLPDIIRALILTPMIRQDKELHIECIDPPSLSDGIETFETVNPTFGTQAEF